MTIAVFRAGKGFGVTDGVGTADPVEAGADETDGGAPAASTSAAALHEANESVSAAHSAANWVLLRIFKVVS
ncbi:hypothetical protein CQ018_12370 [Arthrobacter sp. MYb227]|uniref:hypothetical protein n=1 Tax=Arthrobacter sp. MYb227 TaxID=1848601 RepID=UPI000CFB14B0|nr:hypothetical protein [Arthrobacter sp. MYb227]PQZ92292.1 hypothetical protein CQ018_12370 [Arthrobacter sp. MYb227]